MNYKRLLGLLLVGCFLQLAACHRSAADRDVDAEINWLVSQTIYKEITLDRDPQISRTASGVKATWQIKTKLGREEYLGGLRKTLSSEYQILQQTDSELTLRRVLPGDEYYLRITASPVSGEPLTVSVVFTAKPD